MAEADTASATNESILSKIKKQVEFYFGDSNYPRDKFLRAKASENPDNWIPLSVIATFKRVQALTLKTEEIAASVQESDIVEVSSDKTSVRRIAPLPDKDDSIHRTVYVKGLPTKATIEDISDTFQKYGSVKSVRIRYRKDKTPKGSAFVEFGTTEQAQAAAAAKNEHDGIELVVMLKQTYFDNKKTERIAKREESKRKQKDEKGDGEDAAAAATKEFPKGVIVGFKGAGAGAMREDVRAAFEPFGTVSYIDYTKDAKDGFVRFAEAEGAAKAAKELADAKTQLGGEALTIWLLEGDEETEYWKRVDAFRAQRVGAGNKRRGGFRGGNKRGGRGRGRGGRRDD